MSGYILILSCLCQICVNRIKKASALSYVNQGRVLMQVFGCKVSVTLHHLH